MEQEEREKSPDPTIAQLEAIYNSGKDATLSFIRFLLDRINILEETAKRQQKDLQELKAQLNKDSHNSNKPPSSDPPFKKPKPKNLRKKSGKKPGGQKGHKGSSLKQVSNPDDTQKIRAVGNCSCGESLSKAETIDYIIRQLFDILLPKLFVTEFKGEVIECKCGKIHQPVFPEGITKETQYGKNIKIFTVYLKNYGFISYDRIAEFFSDVCNFKLSQGTIVKFVNECAEKAKPAVEKVKAKLTAGQILHCDETGIRIKGVLHWLHVAGNNKLTYYYPHKNRGKAALDEINMLANYKGTVVHDHWESYYQYTNCVHALCNAHHLRELIFFEENGEVWAKNMIKNLLAAKTEVEKEGSLSKERITNFKKRIRSNIAAGIDLHPENRKRNGTRGRPKQSKAYNLLKRLKTKLDDVLRFIIDPRVPFDNNQGERDVRMVKVQQKVSGTFRSMEGAVNFCIVRGYLSSIRKNGQSIFHALASLWDKKIMLPDALFKFI